MAHGLSATTTLGIIRNLDRFLPGGYDQLGIKQEDIEVLKQNFNWDRTQLNTVMRTMNSILFGALEMMGVPKIIVPSEYVAAVIATIPDPCNMMALCIWMSQERQTGVGALELAARQSTPSQYDPTSADILFAQVCEVLSHEATTHTRQQLEIKFGLRVDEAERHLA